MFRANTAANAFDLGRISWRSYNIVKKKAMEQEFSWSGLLLSLSIAFFVVVACAQGLSMIYQSTLAKMDKARGVKIYRLESQEPRPRIRGNNLLGAEAAEAAALDFQGQVTNPTVYLALAAGQETSITITIKNTGSQIWRKDKVFLETGPFLRSFSKFKGDNWLNYYRPAALGKDIAPGRTASLSVSLKAPSGLNGDIQEGFQLVKDNQPILGTAVRLFVKLKDEAALNKVQAPATVSVNKPAAPAASVPAAPLPAPTAAKPAFCIAAVGAAAGNDHDACQTDSKENDQTNGESQYGALGQEPTIRVGIFKTKDAQRVTVDQYFDIYAGQNILFSGLAPNTVIITGFDFSKKVYYVTTNSSTKYTSDFIRFVPRNKGAVVTLPDFINRPGWNSSLNDNRFRNIMEFHYSAQTGNYWAINELPIEDYLKGLAETSNASPEEFQKVLITAARTYAMYHYNRGVENGVPDGSTKHASEHFHVDSVYDQVYRGYNSEIRMPKLARASDETRGMVMAYNNEIVVTPYYSRSDGRSRDWQEVWGGSAKPWLVSVPIPEDAGQTLWGHGVGMSARAALIMAADENKSWQDILKYFYRGIDFKKEYN